MNHVPNHEDATARNDGEVRHGPVAKKKKHWVRRFIVGSLFIALFGTVATIGPVLWNLSRIKRVAIPKDQGVDPSTVSSVALPKEWLATTDDGVGGSDAAVPATDTGPDTGPDAGTDPGPDTGPDPGPDPGPEASLPGIGSPEQVPGLPISVPGDSAPDAPTDNLPSAAGVANAKQNVVVPGDISDVGVLGGPGTKNYLMAGDDNRTDVADGDAKAVGKGLVTGARTDTIMLLRIDSKNNKAWVLSFPRDLWIKVPGTDQFEKLNAVYAKGPDVLVEALRENFNVRVDHLVIVNFAGFRKIVDALDGVGPICFKKPSRDIKSGLKQAPGCNMLDGTQAMAYVRSRKFQTGEDGVWTDDPSSDIGRIKRQQIFLRAVISRARSRGLNNPVTLNATVANLSKALTLDKGFGIGELASLAADLRSFSPDDLKGYTVPTVSKRIGKQDVQIATKDAAPLLSIFGRRPAPTK
jgi:LCP family protein required for cell wall assembly